MNYTNDKISIIKQMLAYGNIFKIVGDKHHRLLQYNQISTAIAVGMLLSAIQYVGLSTVVTSPLNVGSNISRILRRPSNEWCFCVCSVLTEMQSLKARVHQSIFKQLTYLVYFYFAQTLYSTMIRKWITRRGNYWRACHAIKKTHLLERSFDMKTCYF
ncbi:hypothetical protein DICVIV_05608 [Dictyocaulus viviparus]|uniref:Uncharacterized protein n=1 Tax=Dictyocaulus viviparus TaxID=29172 RepID=A0A0D8XX06_DICVI|nr:hypothetical protein DICVIV_05608 [Dictyocaulus viviparus]